MLGVWDQPCRADGHWPPAAKARPESQQQNPVCYSIIEGKLQALVYDNLPPTTAVFSYAIGSRKLSANEQFLFFVFVGA